MNKLKGDYLILLVGTNPIPNYIAAFGLSKKNSKVYLVHSRNTKDYIGTEMIAKSIEKLIKRKRPDIDVVLCGCDKSYGKDIRSALKKVIDGINTNAEENGFLYGNQVIHLNYTGGTKAMAALTYSYIKECENNDSGKFRYLYSYLDNEIEKLIYDENNEIKNIELKLFLKECNPNIVEICELHGYEVSSYRDKTMVDDVEILCNIVIKRLQTENINYNFEYIFRYGFKFCCARKVNSIKNKECKMELFKLKDNASKVCGEYTSLCIISNIEDKETLKNEVDDFYKTKVSNNILVINEEEDIFKTIIEWIKWR